MIWGNKTLTSLVSILLICSTSLAYSISTASIIPHEFQFAAKPADKMITSPISFIPNISKLKIHDSSPNIFLLHQPMQDSSFSEEIAFYSELYKTTHRPNPIAREKVFEINKNDSKALSYSFIPIPTLEAIHSDSILSNPPSLSNSDKIPNKLPPEQKIFNGNACCSCCCRNHYKDHSNPDSEESNTNSNCNQGCNRCCKENVDSNFDYNDVQQCCQNSDSTNSNNNSCCCCCGNGGANMGSYSGAGGGGTSGFSGPELGGGAFAGGLLAAGGGGGGGSGGGSGGGGGSGTETGTGDPGNPSSVGNGLHAPEPSTYLILGGILAFAFYLRRGKSIAGLQKKGNQTLSA